MKVEEDEFFGALQLATDLIELLEKTEQLSPFEVKSEAERAIGAALMLKGYIESPGALRRRMIKEKGVH
jgi:hypothetical protein